MSGYFMHPHFIQQAAVLDQTIAGCAENDFECMIEGERLLLSLLNHPCLLKPEIMADLLRVVRDHAERVARGEG